ncbi:MAG TPA: hypothetical protein EYQ50_06090 [Verrucomicrobiales bacterium]|nr:hypothetical protein [Verrucomicrobiales bacterium]
MKTKFTITLSAVLAVCSTAFSVEEKSLDGSRPNIILMMADDLGYGDTGFNGNTIIKTQHLDRMAQDGVKLTHFYAGNSVCSPTRGTCLTGRHHHRYGIWTANKGHLPKQEITLARMLKEQGYATGHLGTLDKVISAKDANRKPEANFAPPWQRDYDRSFVTESAVNTWNPGSGSRSKDNPFYDDGKDSWPILAGKTDQHDKAIPFVRGKGVSLVKGRFKLRLPKGKLYDLSKDWSEQNDVAAAHPERVELMTKEATALVESFKKSHSGADYNDPAYVPVDKWGSPLGVK